MSSTLALLFNVKGKVFGMCSRKILRPDPGLYSQYFPSYAIFLAIFSITYETRLKIGCLIIFVSQKCHNSKSIVNTEYRPGSGLKIFCESIPKNFPLTPKLIGGVKKYFKRAK